MLSAELEAFRRSLEGKTKAETDEIAVRYYCALKEARIHLAEHENVSTQMASQYQQVKEEVERLRKEVDILREQNLHLTGIQTLQSNTLFGQKTEKTAEVLGRLLTSETPKTDPLAEDGTEGRSTAANEADETKKKIAQHVRSIVKLLSESHEDKKPGRKKRMDLSGLPEQIDFDYDIEELNRTYGEGNWRFAFWSERKTVEVIRQTTYVKHIYKPIVSVGLDHQMFRPSWENPLIPKSVASASMVAQLMTDWAKMFTPLYRQEMNEERFGFALSRQVMSYWIFYTVQNYLKPVYLDLCEMLKVYRYQHCDETHWLVIMDGRKPGAKSYFWVHRSGELLQEPAIVAYCYEKTRSADHLRNFYSGILSTIYLTCDAYSAYSCFADESSGQVTLTGCYMHCRRRFVDALLILKPKGMTDEQIRELPEVKAVNLIAEIYIEENALKELSADERHELRQKKVRPKVNAFFDYIKAIDVDAQLVSEKLKDAVQYALNQEDCLRQFLKDGNIPLDNGVCERSVRPATQFRRNSLFSFTESGAEVAAVIFTLIETAKANGADPYYYLKYLLEQMPQYYNDPDKSYMPDMRPWSEQYISYETAEKQDLLEIQLPQGRKKPKTPRKRDKATISA